MKALRILTIATTALVFTGCANPGIVEVSPDTYLLSRADHAGIFGNALAMKADVIRDADQFAESKGKVAIPISIHETPAFPGHFATIDYQFRLVNKKEARPTPLLPRADVVIENKEKVSADIKTNDETKTADDLYAALIKLDDLRKRGILTESEFEAEKKKLLGETK